MNVLITGGCGFIGMNMLELLFQKEEVRTIVNVDKMTYASNQEGANLVWPGYKFVQEDICNTKKISQLIKDYKIDHVLQLAAESHVDNSIANPSPFIDSNIKGTFSILEAIRLAEHEVKLLAVSTDEVYGSLDSDDDPFKYDSPLNPSSPYSASKASADLLCLAYQKTYGMKIHVTRCSNNYGPWQHKEKLIPKIIDNTFQHIATPIYGDGQNVRDWIYVQDHCKVLYQILSLDHCWAWLGQVFNIGNYDEQSNLSIVKTIADKMQQNTLIQFVTDRLGHDFRYAIQPNIGFTKIQMISFDQGIQQTINWYKNNKRNI